MSRSVARKPWGTTIRALTTSTQLFDFQRDQVMSGLEHFVLQGFPRDIDLSHMSEAKVREMAGQAMSLPCLATILFSAFLIPDAPWWVERAPPDTSASSSKRPRTS